MHALPATVTVLWRQFSGGWRSQRRISVARMLTGAAGATPMNRRDRRVTDRGWARVASAGELVHGGLDTFAEDRADILDLLLGQNQGR